MNLIQDHLLKVYWVFHLTYPGLDDELYICTTSCCFSLIFCNETPKGSMERKHNIVRKCQLIQNPSHHINAILISCKRISRSRKRKLIEFHKL